jgi:hypothetical protein
MTHRSLRSALAGRGFMLFPAAAYAVHDGRYRLGYGSQASQALAAQGHGYLDSLAPWIAVLLALGGGSWLLRVARAAAGRRDAGPLRSFAGLWLLAWASLVVTYTVQEWLEGIFAAGHPGGLAGIFGHGGWWAVVLAVLAGLGVAAVLRASTAVVQVVSRLAAKPPSLAAGAEPPRARPAALLARRRAPLTDGRAGRAPPARTLAASA